MRLSLGATSHDLTSRALVMGVVDGWADIGGQAGALVAAGADIVDLGRSSAACEVEERDLVLAVLAAARAAVDVPLCVATASRTVAAAALAAGAALVDVETAIDVALVVTRTAGAVAVVSGGPDRADAGGPDPSRLLLQTSHVGQVARLVRSGHPVMLRVRATDACPLATMAVGLIRGARVVGTPRARDARRMCDVLAAVAGAG